MVDSQGSARVNPIGGDQNTYQLTDGNAQANQDQQLLGVFQIIAACVVGLFILLSVVYALAINCRSRCLKNKEYNEKDEGLSNNDNPSDIESS